MFLTNTALTAEALLDILNGSEKEITTTSPSGFEDSYTVVDMDLFRSALRGVIAEQPANLFADLIGLNREQAQAYIDTRCNGNGNYNNANTRLPLVSTVTVFFEDGAEAPDLYKRTSDLRGTSGMITGKGLGKEYDLIVSFQDGVISEIIHYGE